MVVYIYDKPETLITFEPIYNLGNESRNLSFDFEVVYRREPNSDGESNRFSSLALVVNETREVDKKLLIGSARHQIEDMVCDFLNNMEIPLYRDVVYTLSRRISELKNSPEDVERIRVWLDVIVPRFPAEYEYDESNDYVVDVKRASNEAVKKHLEKTTVVAEGYCVICMDTIRIGSSEARMPCSHVFHRTCGEKWLHTSAICPVCRTVFPS